MKPAGQKATGRAAWMGTALAIALLAAPAAIMAQESSSAPAATPAPAAPAAAADAAQEGPRVTSSAKIAPARAASYDNRWEVYGGLAFLNGQAGQNLPKRYNAGGAEGMATYWLGPHLGVAGDYRWAAGTTPVFPNHYYNRVLVMQNIFGGGVQWRGPKNRYVAVDYHALVGEARGTYDHAIQGYPGGSPISAADIGLYPNSSTPWGAVGGSIDFNYKANIAIRLSPDLTFEHYGTETREFVGVSMGVVWRLGKR